MCYGSGVAEVHTHTAAEASMCENKLFFERAGWVVCHLYLSSLNLFHRGGGGVAGGLSAAPLYSHRYLRVLQRCQTSLQAGTADETGQERGRPPHAELITEKILLLRGRVFGVGR